MNVCSVSDGAQYFEIAEIEPMPALFAAEDTLIGEMPIRRTSHKLHTYVHPDDPGIYVVGTYIPDRDIVVVGKRTVTTEQAVTMILLAHLFSSPERAGPDSARRG